MKRSKGRAKRGLRDAFDEACALFRNNDFNGAISAYTSVIEEDPSDLDAHFNRALAYLITERPGLAISDLTRIIKSNRRDQDAYVVMSKAYSQLGDPEKALGWYKKGMRIKPAPEKFRTLDRLIEKSYVD